jgi:hypothetical protein
MVALVKVLDAISDNKSLIVFKTIALGKPNSDIHISKMQLTRKQYYSRLSEFMKAGLVKQDIGKYTLTSLGKTVYDSLIIMETALENFWKLKAVDSLKVAVTTGHDSLSKEEHIKILNTLIDNEMIKKIILPQYANLRYVKAEIPLH